MSFVPGLCLHPPSTIRATVFKEVGAIFSERGLIVRSLKHRVAPKLLHLGAQLGALVCMASKLTMCPLTRDGMMRGLSALISLCFSSTLQDPWTVSVVTS